MTRRLVALSAGLSTPSSTRLLTDRLVEATRAAVTARGEDLSIEVIELRELAVELAQMAVGGGLPGPGVARAREAIAAAEGMVAVTPVFTASYSGLFKMFVDVLDPDALNGMPVLVAATAGTARHSLVLEHAMRPLFSHLRAVVVPTGVFAATDDFGSAGNELTDRITRATGELATLLVRQADAVAGFTPGPAPRTRVSGNDVGEVRPFADLLRGHTG